MIDFITVLGGEEDRWLFERVDEHRKTVCEGALTETKRLHERCSQNRGVASMTIAQDTFQGSHEFQSQRARFLLVADESCLLFVYVLHYANDWVCDPIVQIWKGLWMKRGGL